MATENNNLSVYDKARIPNAKNFRFGILVSEWNPSITDGMFQGAFDTIIDCGGIKENIVRWNVPGSFELVYGAKKMQESYEMLDARVTKAFELSDVLTINVSVFGKNLLDEIARNHSSFVKNEVPLPGRSYGLKFNAEF